MLSSGIGFQIVREHFDALITYIPRAVFILDEDFAILFRGTAKATGGSSELHLRPYPR